jgi:hypothetical protein
MKIEKPDWSQMCQSGGRIHNFWKSLDEWFEREVEPINKMLSEGIEVQGNISLHPDKGYSFSGGVIGKHNPTHKALLINIEPIKKETIIQGSIERDRQAEEYVPDLNDGARHAFKAGWNACEENIKNTYSQCPCCGEEFVQLKQDPDSNRLKFELEKEKQKVAALVSSLEKGLEFMWQGKQQFAPNTTNSFVDDWLCETEKLLAKYRGEK